MGTGLSHVVFILYIFPVSAAFISPLIASIVCTIIPRVRLMPPVSMACASSATPIPRE